MSIGQRIKAIRQEQHIKQGELAEKACISQAALSKIEQSSKISRETLLRIARVLTVSPIWLEYGASTEGVEKIPLKWIPVLDWAELADKGPQAVKKENTEVIPVQAADYSDQCFGLIIKDDSMNGSLSGVPALAPNTRIVIEPRKEPSDRSIVLVRVKPGKEPILRMYAENGPNITLIATNKALSLDGFDLTEEMEILGVVVYAGNKF